MTDRTVEAYLRLESFEEFISQYHRFASLPRDTRIFAKTMKLMETDEFHTHREKEQILQKTKRTALSRAQKELEKLRDEIIEEGIWLQEDDEWPAAVAVRYKHPNGKNGDVDAFMMDKISLDGDICEGERGGEVSTDFREEIAMIVLPQYRIIQDLDYDELARDPAMLFLARYNRIVQAEMKMNEINRYKEIYRSLRTIPDLKLKHILNTYHEEIRNRRHEIYESLIADDLTRGKWISEQTAFRIVRTRYPDARYQVYFSWLGWQSLDIYIPSRRTAIEYQGKQHYEPVAFFGGEEALKDNQARDHRKRFLCRKYGIRVIDWDFDQPLTEEYFARELVPVIEGEKPV